MQRPREPVADLERLAIIETAAKTQHINEESISKRVPEGAESVGTVRVAMCLEEMPRVETGPCVDGRKPQREEKRGEAEGGARQKARSEVRLSKRSVAAVEQGKHRHTQNMLIDVCPKTRAHVVVEAQDRQRSQAVSEAADAIVEAESRHAIQHCKGVIGRRRGRR